MPNVSEKVTVRPNQVMQSGASSPKPGRLLSERFLNAHIGAMRIFRDCGITGSLRGMLTRDPDTAHAREQGTAAQRNAIEELERWLAHAEAYEALHGVGSLVDRNHDFVKLLLRTSRIPGVARA